MNTIGTSTEEETLNPTGQTEEVLIKTYSLDLKNTEGTTHSETSEKVVETSTKDIINLECNTTGECAGVYVEPTVIDITELTRAGPMANNATSERNKSPITEGLPGKGSLDASNVTSLLEQIPSNSSIFHPKSTTKSTFAFTESETIEETKEKLSSRVFFYLYTRKNPEQPQILEIDNTASLKSSHYDVKKPTKFVTHGWDNNYLGLNCETIRKAFLQHGNYNIIVVDWGAISKTPYRWACSRLKITGAFIARMINFLDKKGCNLEDMSLIGHSLGAHLMGFAGRNTKRKVGHLVGLDPALPRFRNVDSSERISRGDAKLVEIIHTNAGHLGLAEAIGDLDFYPNGGAKQPGCGADENGHLSHARAYEYYAETINSKVGFYGKKADSYDCFLAGRCKGTIIESLPGPKAVRKERGSYFLRTQESSPYSMGTNGIMPSHDQT